MIHIEKILVPTDFSSYSDKAFQEALEIAESFNSKIYLVHVIRGESQFKIMETFDEETQERVRRELAEKTDIEFAKQMDKFPLSKKLDVVKKVAKGVTYKEILEFQKEIDPDIIVISAHGRSDFENFFFGSTAEKIVRRSECSVLLVK